jgi:hypothetical protein
LEKIKTQDSRAKQTFIFTPYLVALGQFEPYGYTWEHLKKYKKNEFITHFGQKSTRGSYGVGM